MSELVDERITEEVEVLKSILLDDVIVKTVNDVPQVIETVVHPWTGDDTDRQFVCITLEVRLTPHYPDSSPEVTLKNPRGLDDELLNNIHQQIKDKLNDYLGLPVVYELIELIREKLTESNLPSGRCPICLFGFLDGDVFTKTQCYHHFHSLCLANHFISGEKYYQEDLEKLPQWQRSQQPSFMQTCPVCRSPVSCDVETLRESPQPVEADSAQPFQLTPELKLEPKRAKPSLAPKNVIFQFQQKQREAVLARQIARGGVVGVGDTGPPPLTITTPTDNDNESSNSAPTTPRDASKPTPLENQTRTGHPSHENAGSPRNRPIYRGFNRRGRPGRGRGHSRAPT